MLRYCDVRFSLWFEVEDDRVSLLNNRSFLSCCRVYSVFILLILLLYVLDLERVTQLLWSP